MPDKKYDITHFLPEHKSQVLDLLTHLWKYEHHAFSDLFRWKYFDNPNSEMPLGIVALYNSRVVGFRGYFANRFVINGINNNIIVLHPGDTCVDPNHRKNGLSVAMGNLATQYNTSKYPLLMNMTCNNKSLPGYLKLGFQPLDQKISLKWCSLNPLELYRYHKAGRDNKSLAIRRIKLGQFGDILVSDSPLPELMASIIKTQAYPKGKICLYQDQTFFEWRFKNPVHKYVFYYFMKNKIAQGYIVIDVSDRNYGTILDYGESNDQAIAAILTYLIKSKNFVVLSIYDYGIDDKLRKVLSSFLFIKNHPLKRLKRIIVKSSDERQPLPLLIRPVKKSFTEDNFFIEKVDVRKIDNWRLKPICSDAV